jgi:hypothetical protein
MILTCTRKYIHHYTVHDVVRVHVGRIMDAKTIRIYFYTRTIDLLKVTKGQKIGVYYEDGIIYLCPDDPKGYKCQKITNKCWAIVSKHCDYIMISAYYTLEYNKSKQMYQLNILT